MFGDGAVPIRTQIQVEVPLDGRMTTADLGDVACGLVAVLGEAGDIVLAVAGDRGNRVLTIEGTAEREIGGL